MNQGLGSRGKTGGGILEQTSVVLASWAGLATAHSLDISRASISLSVPISSGAGGWEVVEILYGQQGTGGELFTMHRMTADSVVKRKGSK